MLFGWAQDHKRAFDGDEGPNTGGMGTYSPAPVFTLDLVEQARDAAGRAGRSRASPPEGAPYRGVLFVELMATAPRPQAGGVQRPLRRPGMPGADAAAGERPRPLPAWPAPPGRLARAAASRSGATRRRSAWCWPPRAIPDAPQAGSADQRRRRRLRAGRRGLPCRHRARRGRRAAGRPAGGCSTSAPAAPTSREARERAYGAVAADRLARGLPPHRHRLAAPWLADAPCSRHRGSVK